MHLNEIIGNDANKIKDIIYSRCQQWFSEGGGIEEGKVAYRGDKALNSLFDSNTHFIKTHHEILVHVKKHC